MRGSRCSAARAHPWIEALEQAIGTAGAICNAITGWENRWAQRNLVDQHPDGVSARAKHTLARAEAMSPEDYRAALLERETAQLCYTRLAPLADAVITLSCPGPAPSGPAMCLGSRWRHARPAMPSLTIRVRCCLRRP